MTKKNLFTLVLCLFCFGTTTHAQRIPTLEEAVYGGLIKTEGGSNVNWMKDGERYSKIEKNAEGAYEVTAYKAKDNSKEVLIPANMLLNPQTGKPISVRNFVFSEDNSKVLIYTNTRRVWRYDTRGDYWVLNLKDGKLQQLGKSLPEATLMFAKFSPDASRVAFIYRFWSTGTSTNYLKTDILNLLSEHSTGYTKKNSTAATVSAGVPTGNT